jgi:hypothetical protein
VGSASLPVDPFPQLTPEDDVLISIAGPDLMRLPPATIVEIIAGGQGYLETTTRKRGEIPETAERYECWR